MKSAAFSVHPMLRKNAIAILSTIFLCLCAAGPIHALDTPYTGIPRTIAHDFLDMEKKFGASDEHSTYINSLINKAASLITTKENYSDKEAFKILGQIDSLLKKEGFRFKNNFLLNHGITSKEIDCDNYSTIYTAIAEVLRIPIIPVYAPGHSFVRFSFSDGSYVNWDPIKTTPLPNAYYIRVMNISQDSIQKGVYLKSLSRKEFLGVEYNSIGTYLITLKKYRESIPYLTMAIKLYPQFSSAYHNRGSALYALRQGTPALRDLLGAASLDPNRATTHNTIGDIYFDLKDYTKAVRHYTASIKLDPAQYPPYRSIGQIMKLQGREDLSVKWLKKAEEIKARNPQ
jgi:tetratricopeptide (TPR) repeat protein